MADDPSIPLAAVFDGWDGYQASLVLAVRPRTREQLTWRPAPHLRSAGEIALHLALGRVDWFARMPAPGSLELAERVHAIPSTAALAEDPGAIDEWLEASWAMIDATLHRWTVADLARTYRHEYWGKVYAVSFQWTIWRILTHDVHHGGELALMFGQQNIALPELGDLFGHLAEPPLAD